MTLPAYPDVAQTSAVSSRRRSFGLYAITALLLINAVLIALDVSHSYVRLGLSLGLPRWLFPAASQAVVDRFFRFATAGCFIAVSVGIWTLNRWAWAVLMILVGTGLGEGILRYLRHDPNYPVMLINVLDRVLPEPAQRSAPVPPCLTWTCCAATSRLCASPMVSCSFLAPSMDTCTSPASGCVRGTAGRECWHAAAHSTSIRSRSTAPPPPSAVSTCASSRSRSRRVSTRNGCSVHAVFAFTHPDDWLVSRPGRASSTPRSTCRC